MNKEELIKQVRRKQLMSRVKAKQAQMHTELNAKPPVTQSAHANGQTMPQAPRTMEELSKIDPSKPLMAGVLATAKAGSDFSRGAESLLNKGKEAITGDNSGVFRDPSLLDAEQTKWDKRLAPYKEEHPLSTSLMPVVPELGVGGGPSMFGRGAAKMIGALAKTAGVNALLGATRDSKNQGKDAASESALATGANILFGNAARMFNAKKGIRKANWDIHPERAKQVESLESKGFELTPAQFSGKSGLKSMESAASTSPITAGIFEKAHDKNLDLLTSKVANHFGKESNGHFGKELYKEIGEDITDVFKKNASKKELVPVSKLFGNTVKAEFPGHIKQLKKLQGHIDEITDAATNGKISMSYLNNKVIELRSMARSGKSNKLTQRSLNDLATSLDSKIKNGIGSARYNELVEARQKHKVYQSLKKGLDKNIGKIKPGPFQTQLNKFDDYGYNHSSDNPLYSTLQDYMGVLEGHNKDIVGARGVVSNAVGNPLSLITDITSYPVLKQYKKGYKGTKAFLNPKNPMSELVSRRIGEVGVRKEYNRED